jgi:hypothetical protein
MYNLTEKFCKGECPVRAPVFRTRNRLRPLSGEAMTRGLNIRSSVYKRELKDLPRNVSYLIRRGGWIGRRGEEVETKSA